MRQNPCPRCHRRRQQCRDRIGFQADKQVGCICVEIGGGYGCGRRGGLQNFIEMPGTDQGITAAAVVQDVNPIAGRRCRHGSHCQTARQSTVSGSSAAADAFHQCAGDADTGPWRSALLTHLRETVDDKLEVARGPLRGEPAKDIEAS